MKCRQRADTAMLPNRSTAHFEVVRLDFHSCERSQCQAYPVPLSSDYRATRMVCTRPGGGDTSSAVQLKESYSHPQELLCVRMGQALPISECRRGLEKKAYVSSSRRGTERIFEFLVRYNRSELQCAPDITLARRSAHPARAGAPL